MGFFDDYKNQHGTDTTKNIVNVEWVLKILDSFGLKACPYKVGDILLSTTSVNPGISQFPGTTWMTWGSGRVPVGTNTNDSDFNVVEKTGGNKTHALSIEEMPSHNHSEDSAGLHQHSDHQFEVPGVTQADAWNEEYDSTRTHWERFRNQAIGYNNTITDTNNAAQKATNMTLYNTKIRGTASTDSDNASIGYFVKHSANGSHSHTIKNSGSSNAHNNLQPYITCYMWKRTA